MIKYFKISKKIPRTIPKTIFAFFSIVVGCTIIAEMIYAGGNLPNYYKIIALGIVPFILILLTLLDVRSIIKKENQNNETLLAKAELKYYLCINILVDLVVIGVIAILFFSV